MHALKHIPEKSAYSLGICKSFSDDQDNTEFWLCLQIYTSYHAGKHMCMHLVALYALLLYLLKLALEFSLSLQSFLSSAHIQDSAIQLFAIHISYCLPQREKTSVSISTRTYCTICFLTLLASPWFSQLTNPKPRECPLSSVITQTLRVLPVNQSQL